MNTNDKSFRNDYYNDNYVTEQEKYDYIYGKNPAYSDNQQNGYQSHDNNSTVATHEHPEEKKYIAPREHNIPQKPKKKKRIFLKVILTIIGFFLVAILVFLAFLYSRTLGVPEKTNFLIMATDKNGTRTDTLMLGTFDKKDKEITLISIPRDTYVTVSDKNFDLMCKEYPQPGSKSMKINTVYHFAGEKQGIALVCNEVSRLMDTHIDFYVKVDFDAFRHLIDSLGGIEFDVPQDMYYSDPYQDLYIDLKAGEQILDGEEAEHLLRYRSGYAAADLRRVEVQQDFVKALISQTLSKDTILSNPGLYFDLIFKYDFIETNAGVSDIGTYALLVGGINSDDVDTFTLPGANSMAGGQSVYLPNVSEIENKVSKIIGN